MKDENANEEVEYPVKDLHRGDMVMALGHLDLPGADVRLGTIGVVFEETNAYKDGGGPMVKWMNMGSCNVYDGQVKRIHGMSKTRVAMNIKESIYLLLHALGCTTSEEAGILTVKTREGVVWDMTIPQVKK